MPAEIESMMYAGDIPWHGLGTALPHNVGWSDALGIAGLDWTVMKRRAFVQSCNAAPGIKVPVECAGFRALVRERDDSVFAVVTERYAPIQNCDAFAVFGELFGDAAVLHTAGALRGGRVVWGLAEFPEPFTVADDKHRRFLLVTTRHDGTGCMRAFPTAVRVVCNNTLNLAMGGRREGVAIRHTGDVETKIKAQSAVLATTLGMFAEYQRAMETLLTVRVDHATTEGVLGKLVNLDSARGRNAARRIAYLAEHGRGNAPYRGTAYALFQGVTDYVDHERLSNAAVDRRFETQLLTSGAHMKSDALQLLLAV
jgi:phage/plasmid-like protein (TIGR03299 family)